VFLQDRHSAGSSASGSTGGPGMGRPAGRGMPPAPMQPHAGKHLCVCGVVTSLWML